MNIFAIQYTNIHLEYIDHGQTTPAAQVFQNVEDPFLEFHA